MIRNYLHKDCHFFLWYKILNFFKHVVERLIWLALCLADAKLDPYALRKSSGFTLAMSHSETGQISGGFICWCHSHRIRSLVDAHWCKRNICKRWCKRWRDMQCQTLMLLTKTWNVSAEFFFMSHRLLLSEPEGLLENHLCISWELPQLSQQQEIILSETK